MNKSSPLVPYMCFAELGHHRLRQWLVVLYDFSPFIGWERYLNEKKYQSQPEVINEIALKDVVCNFTNILSRGRLVR